LRVIIASCVFPVTSPPIRDGAVAIVGDRIAAVGRREEILACVESGADVHDLGPAALLPGLVNAHCHVELSWMAEDPPPGGDYAGWVRGLLERRAREEPDRARVAAERAIESMVSRGTVALGDVANETWVVPLLARSPLCGVVFHEIYSPRASEAERVLAQAIERVELLARDPDLERAGDRWRIVLAPHAPHTTSEPLLRALAGRARAAGAPLGIHASESAAEVAFLENATGPLSQLFRERGMWDDAWEPPGLTPIELLDRLGVLGPRGIAVHCVRLVHRDHAKLRSRGVHVVTCPRSNERLGVGLAPVPALLAGGVPVALGTDSLASAPDLDLFAEMAALRRAHPGLAPAAVLRMATWNGAVALGLADRLGSIEPGKLACLVVVPMNALDDDPLVTICSEPEVVWPVDRAPHVEVRA